MVVDTSLPVPYCACPRGHGGELSAPDWARRGPRARENANATNSLGFAPRGIPAYTCDYNTSVSCPPYCACSSGVSYQHQANGLYYGVKFQCVEFSRLWLIHVQGLAYGDVGMAYEIFPLREAIRVQNDSSVP